jgi:DNA-binding transcriptional ArsR family regulator
MVEAAPDARRLLHHGRALVRRFAVSERADVFCCGMTIAQAATLETLRLEGPLRMGDLGRRLGIAPSTLTRNLQRLLDMGYVKREGRRQRRPGGEGRASPPPAAARRTGSASGELRREILGRTTPPSARRSWRAWATCWWRCAPPPGPAARKARSIT